MKPRIIIGLPQSFEVNNLIQKNLEILGFEVINISYPEHKKLKKTFTQNVIYIFRKLVLGDRNYKSILKFAPYKNNIINQINSIKGKVDYTLLIRADIYPLDIISKLKEKSNSLITYHWDGLHRFPAINKMIPYFDRFFIFDPKDCNQGYLPTTNFYFDSESDSNDIKLDFDFYFMGSYITQRMPIIEDFINKTRSLNLNCKYYIYCTDKNKTNKYKQEEINYLSTHISYSENIAYIKKSKVILDFLNGTHHGLSFRVFEAIQFDKKLITNNKEIKKYDFYNENNIFIWKGDNISELKSFLSSDYIIQNEIKRKYAFSNWIQYILDRQPNIPISLPR